jgi:hypothetical protein
MGAVSKAPFFTPKPLKPCSAVAATRRRWGTYCFTVTIKDPRGEFGG